MQWDVASDEREMLIETEPRVFHTTPHYADYAAVLVYLEPLDAGTARTYLERRWRKIAPKTLVRRWDDGLRSAGP